MAIKSKQVESIAVSTGASDGGKLVRTKADGTIDPTLVTAAGSIPAEYQARLREFLAYPYAFRELLTAANGDPATFYIWDSEARGTALLTEVYTWATNGDLLSIATTANGITVTETYTFPPNGGYEARRS